VSGQPALVMDPSFTPASVRPALVWGLDMGVDVAPTAEAPAFLSGLLARVRSAGEAFLPPERKAAVRAMLRHGKYKPAGRSKPSSEYLLAAALESAFPLINGPVDVNNAVSLEWGYPASIFDAALCGESLLLRRGMPGESYIFNPSGQSIDLEDLVCICRSAGSLWKPCGNPVRDAMETKVREGARSVAAVIYAPRTEPPAGLEAAAARFAALLASHCGAAAAGWSIP
jgi:DNA/RNA-binding domain of Phe-tRNA-synthetase-like protein